MTHNLTIPSLARLAVSATLLMIVGFFVTPAIARAAPNAQGTGNLPKRQVLLPFVTSMNGGVAPSITSAPPLFGTIGVTYTYSVTATGSPTPTLSLDLSPESMTLDENGLIEWLPDTAGIYSVTVVAVNGIAPDAVQSFAIDVSASSDRPPTITSTPVLTGSVGVTYTYAVTASGSPTPTFSLEAGPEGMTLDENGLIEWLPGESGTYSVTVIAGNGIEPDAEQSFAVTVSEVQSPVPDRLWDPRLDQRGAVLVEANVKPGQGYWRLVEARWFNTEESQGRHHIFMDVLDVNGVRLVGVPLVISWADGSGTAVSELKPGEPYAANFAMYAVAPAYSAQPITAAPADRVEGMGLGELDAPDYGHHTSYGLTWQWTVMSP